jgi:hypothetical protein
MPDRAAGVGGIGLDRDIDLQADRPFNGVEDAYSRTR